jgi:hypothetical protein|tara:strand:- start:396 stop:1037 length:642 start_codon:yes stop_codon:yes gene_type:complete
MIVDLFLVYQFIRRLATPFNKWDAFKQGIIDDKGQILIKKKDRDATQKKAFGVFDVMVTNIKKLLAKVPGGGSKLASYAAALFLIKEYNAFSDESILNEDLTDEQLEESLLLFNDRYVNYIKENADVKALNEEIKEAAKKRTFVAKKDLSSFRKKINTKPSLEEEPAANSVGAGGIAGMDAGHMSKAAQKKWTSGNKSDKKKRLRDVIGVPTK